ncbi:hypothetical protein ACX0GZ_14735 [Sphingomonas aestuarii]
MAFGYEHFKTTPAGRATAHALSKNSCDVIAAAKNGRAPIRVLAPELRQHLGERTVNSHVGRMIREWLGATFKLRGRKRWPRENGTESGSVYFQID